MKRRLMALLVILCTLLGVLGIAIACKPEETPKVSGSEAGVYYCDYNGAEYSLNLGEECKFTLKIASETMEGEYVLENETLTLNVSSGDPIAATYKNDAVTLSHREVTYTFLRKIEYTFKFDTDGGSSIADAKVVNGRVATKPADPTKEDKVFVGWYTDNTYINPYYFSQPVTEDTTVYARFVEKLDPEFTVKFDANYAGADPIDPVTTAGNILYSGMLPVPERAGFEFVGWYVSQFEDGKKLSYAYTDQKIAENLTLYAVWDDGAPYVSVNENGVEMSANGSNRSYSLTLTAPDGTTVTDSKALANGATTSFAYDFASKAAGEYKVEVVVDGKTTTRYFNNKALARVSVFKVENSTLIFNGVANATKYTVSVVCGTDGHTHKDISLDDKTAYNFENCDMRPEGITFVVKAYASGYVTSTSEVYTYINHLSQVQNVAYDSKTQEVTWSAVEHATSYAVTVKLGGQVVVNNEDVGNVTSYSVKNIDSGEAEIRVTALAHGWNSSEVTIAQFTKDALAAPKNVQFAGNRVTWDAVKGAKGYRVMIGGRAVETSSNYYEMKAEDFSGGALEITVYAVGETEANNSFASDSVTLRNDGKVQKITYKAGRAVWDYVYGATAYEVKIGSGEVQRVSTAGMDVKFSSAGEQNISVRAIFGDKPATEEDWATTTVRVYTVEFIMGTSEIPGVDTLYLASGDAIELPTPEWTGYEYHGWYTAPGGASGEGRQYSSTRFGGGNLKLYASFTPCVFHITLVAGDMGEWQEQTIEVTYRQSDFALPVPVSNSVEYTFQGWYRGVGGTGAVFSDMNGKNTGTYTLLKDITLYARWSTPFVYQKVQGGYSISLTDDDTTSSITEITLPEKHLNEKVVTVEDLSAGKKLQTVNIPNTVETISLGSVGKAFDGLTALKEVNIYPVEDNRDPKYASKDGMVYEIEGNRLIFVPMSVGTTVTLPDNIQVIVAGAIYKNRTITTLTIPASVYEVQADAIHGNGSTIDKIATIKFTPSEDANATLTIADGAFASINSLTTVEIPKYTEEFTSAKLKSCTKLANINVANGVAGDKYFSDNGVLCRTTDLDGKANVREIVYYPVARTNTSYTIPAGITSIGDNAFKSAANLTSVTIPASITNIGASAFEACSKVTTLTFSGDANSNDLKIGEKAFYNTKPTKLTIPANVVKVGQRAFYISTLTSITLQGKPGMSVSYTDGAFQSVAADLKIEKDFPVIDIAGVFSTKSGDTATKITAAKLKSVDVSANSNYLKVTDEKADGYGAIFSADKSRILYIEKPVANFVMPDGITEIGSAVFAGNTSIKSVTIPASVTSISDFAFQGCTVLDTVTFSAPEAGKDRAPLTVGNSAFYECKALQKLTLPAETAEIGSYAFYKCDFTEFTVPGKVRAVGADCFEGCASLTKITIGEGVESIGASVFKSATKLKEVYLPSTLISIGEEAFFGCNVLEKIEVTEGSHYFKTVDGALYGLSERAGAAGTYDPVTLLAVPIKCEGDEGRLHVPATVTKVVTRAMQYNSGIVHLEFADKVVAYDDTGAEILGSLELDKYAFMGSSSANYPTKLETVKLPVGLTVIGQTAFGSCGKLTTINIPYTVKEINNASFSSCNSIVDGLTFDETPAGAEKVPLVLMQGALYLMSGITKIVLPERTVELGSSMFNGDSALKSVTLPSTIPSIPKELFKGLALLEEVIFPEKFEADVTIGENAFENCTALTKLGTPKQVAPDPAKPNEKVEVYFLPEGIVEIGRNAFLESGLTSIGLPSTFATIAPAGSQIFSSCSNLKVIAFADDCALEELPFGLITYASSLEHVIFGAGSHIKTIGTGSTASCVFSGAAHLNTITIPASVEEIGDKAFQSLANLEEVKFEEGSHLAKIGTNAFSGDGLISFTFPTVTNEAGEPVEIALGSNVFDGCAMLETINLSASNWNVTGLFMGCPALNTITADKDSKYIEVDDAGKSVYALNADGDRDTLLYVYGRVEGRVTIPEGTLEIAAGTYSGQTDITEVVLSSTVVKIGASAFEECISLKSVSIAVPQGGVSALSIIDSNAFKNCWALDTFDFGTAKNLNFIGDNAFNKCAFTKLDLSKNVMLGSNAAGTTLNGIGEDAFSSNFKLGTEMINPEAAEADQYSIMFPDEIKFIDASAFRYDVALTRVDLSNTKITVLYGTASSDKGVFSCCTALKEVKLPTCLKKIQGRVFSNSGLEKINLEELVNLTGIDANAFLNAHLTEIVLPAVSLEVNAQAGIFSGNSELVRADLSKVTSAFGSSNTSLFANCTKLKEVKLPKGMTALPTSCFSGCTSLQEVDIPEGVTAIGENAFLNCSSLQHIEFPNGLKTISDPSSLTDTNGAFKGTGLKEVDLSKTAVTVIGGSTFRDVATLTSVKLPETLTTIGNYAFSGTSITSIVIPKNYKMSNPSTFRECALLTEVEFEGSGYALGNYTFQDCVSLTDIDFSKLASIGDYAFQNTGFTQVTIPADVTVGKYAFFNCHSLRSVTVADGVTAIADSLFSNCENLTSINIPASIESIGGSAFAGCTQLTDITWPNTLVNLTGVGSSAFKGTPIKSVDFSTATASKFSSINTSTFAGCTQLTSVLLPDNIITVASGAFEGCSSLTHIVVNGVITISSNAFAGTAFTNFNIGPKVSTIDVNAFYGCENLQKIVVSEENSKYVSGENGELYQRDPKKLMVYPMASPIFKLANDTEEIASGALLGYKGGVDGVFTLPESIKKIESGAFKGVSFEKLIIEHDIDNIMDEAFSESLIREFEITASGTALSSASCSELFRDCPELTKVTITAKGFTTIGSSWFLGCTSLESFDIPDTVTRINSYAFEDTKITEITVPESVTAFGSNALANMHFLERATINATISTSSAAGTYLFCAIGGAGNENLTTVSFGNSVKYIGDNTFRNCTSLTTIDLPDELVSVGTYAFSGTPIEEIQFPESVTSIGDYCFLNCKSLKKFTMPEKVQKLSNYVFQNCTSLVWVYLDENITGLGLSAFAGCTNLKFVNMPELVTTVNGGVFSGADNVHLFIPKGWASFGTGQFWYPTDTNRIYFESSMYDTIASRGVAWLIGNTDSKFESNLSKVHIGENILFDATYEQALQASGVTDFPGQNA